MRANAKVSQILLQAKALEVQMEALIRASRDLQMLSEKEGLLGATELLGDLAHDLHHYSVKIQSEVLGATFDPIREL